MKFRRLMAFIFDLLIIEIMFIILYKTLPVEQGVIKLNHLLSVNNEKFLLHEISFFEYINEFSLLTYKIDKLNIIHTGLNFLLIIFYFIIVPTISKGYTLGLYLFKIKIEKENGKINIVDLFKRNIITTGIIYSILIIFLVLFFNYKFYFYISIILGIIQLLLVIISSFMVIYRKDEKGLQDIISKTKIVDKKKINKKSVKSISGKELLEIIRLGQIQPDIGIDFIYKKNNYTIDYDCIDPTIKEDLLSNILIILKNEESKRLYETTSFQDFFEKAMIGSKYIKDIDTKIMCDIDKYKNYLK